MSDAETRRQFSEVWKRINDAMEKLGDLTKDVAVLIASCRDCQGNGKPKITDRVTALEYHHKSQSTFRKGIRDVVFVAVGFFGTIIGGWLTGRGYEPKEPPHPPAKISVDTTSHAPRS